MVRQPQANEAMQTVAVRLPLGMIADIDAYRSRLKAENPAFRVERGEAMRDLLLKALAMVGDSGPVEAPVTLGADHREDHPPMGEDHSDRKAATTQDHERTTGRTGRKRTTAAKG